MIIRRLLSPDAHRSDVGGYVDKRNPRGVSSESMPYPPYYCDLLDGIVPLPFLDHISPLRSSANFPLFPFLFYP